MSTNQQEGVKSFEQLQEEYEKIKYDMQAEPFGDHANGFNDKAYQYKMQSFGKRDLLLVQMIALKQREIKFVSIEQRENKYHVTYNPYKGDLDRLAGMQYSIVPTLSLKPTSAKIYQEACMEKIVWLTKIMTGPIKVLFDFKFLRWTSKGVWKQNKEAFAKDVASLILSTPHASCYKYLTYLELFIEWMSSLENDNAVIIELVECITEELKVLFYKDKQIQYTNDGTIKMRIASTISFPDWQTCSEQSNALFEEVEFDADENKRCLERIRERCLLERAKRLASSAAQAPADESVLGKRRAEESAEGERVSKKAKGERVVINLDELFEKVNNVYDDDEILDLEPFRAFQEKRRLESVTI